MEAIIRTENKCLFEALLHFLETLNITVEINEKSTVEEENTKKKELTLILFPFFNQWRLLKVLKVL